MKTILWLDDIRNPFNSKVYIEKINYLKDNYLKIVDEPTIVVWIKTETEFCNYIKENGLPDLISFDNDLGIENGEGYECAKWLVNYCLDNNKTLPLWYIHSDNIVARENIFHLFTNFEKTTS